MHLRDSEKRLQEIIDQLPVPLFVKDANSKYILLNKACNEQWGLISSDLIGTTGQNLFPPDMWANQIAEDRLLFTNRVAVETEESHWSVRLQKHRTIRIYKKPCYNDACEPAFLIYVVLDTTEQKLAEEKLLKLSERLHKLSMVVEETGSLIIISDANHIVEYVNPAYLRISDYTWDDVVGQDSSRLSSDQMPVESYMELRDAVSAGKEWRGELVAGKKNGEPFWARGVITVLRNDAGAVNGYVTVMDDISDLKHTEQALFNLTQKLEAQVVERTQEWRKVSELLAIREEESRAMVSNLVDCVITTDSNGIVHSANPALEKLFGYTVDEVVGQNVSMLMPHRSNHDEYMASYLSGGEARIIGVGREMEGQHKNGQLIPIEISVSDYVVSSKQFFTSTLRDIRDRKQLIAELTHAREEAERANQAKSSFLATMSHEIRTPMNAIIGMTELLMTSSLDEEQRKMASAVERSSNSLLAIINDILDFSRIEAGKLECDAIPMSVRDVMESVGDILASNVEKYRLRLNLFIDPHIPVSLIGDPGRLRQILFNFGSNAIKFSAAQDGKRRMVSIRAVLDSGGSENAVQVRFTVVDQGIGMSPEVVDRLFQPFSQAEQATTRHYGGSGLGLSICKRLADLMDGSIEVASKPGVGSKFTLCLPYPISSAPHLADDEPDLTDLGVMLLVSAIAGRENLSIYLNAHGARVYVCDEPQQLFVEMRAVMSTGARGDRLSVVVIGSEVPFQQRVELCQALRQDAAWDKVGVIILAERSKRSRYSDFPMLRDSLSVSVNPTLRSAFLDSVAKVGGRRLQTQEFVPEADVNPPTVEEAAASGQLILVAEDNEVNQDMIMRQLHLLGYAAEIAGNGREALAMYKSQHYGLLLSDWHMPEMDGLELTQTIRNIENERGGHLTIIALTADVLPAHIDQCMKAGMDGHLGKPIKLEDLRITLQRYFTGQMREADRPDQPSTSTSTSTSTPQATPSDLKAAVPVPEKTAATDESVPSARIFDLTKLEAMVGNNLATQSRILKKFVASGQQSLAEVHAAQARGATTEIGALGHKLKSSSRAVGADRLAEVCAALELAGKSNLAEQCVPLIADLVVQFQAVAAAIAAALDDDEVSS